MEVIRKKLKYILIFVISFFSISLLFFSFSVDTYANFGFSYALSIGQVPYKEFNLVVPLFAPFLYSLGLYFNHSILIFYLEQSLLLTIFSYFIFKMLGSKKGWLFLLLMLLPYPIAFVYTIFPGYNFLMIFLCILLIYLEETNKSDSLIGLILGCSIITKHTIGLFFFLPTLVYYRRDFLKVVKRILYAFIPVTLFLLYLVFKGCLLEAFDLCVLGLFSFSSNSGIDIISFILIMISLICSIFLYRKKRNISFLYLFSYLSVVIPMVEKYHTNSFLLVFIFVILYVCDFSKFHVNIKILYRIALVFIMLFILVWIEGSNDFYSIYSYSNFPFKIISDIDNHNIKQLDHYISSQDKRDICLFEPSKNIFYSVRNEKKLSYYSILNNGNHGYNGSKRMMDKIKKEHDVVFLIDNSKYDPKFLQYMEELPDYIKNNAKLIKKFDNYEVYYKE